MLKASRRVWQTQVEALREVMACKARPGAVEVVACRTSVVQGVRSYPDKGVGSHLEGEVGDRMGMDPDAAAS